MRAVPISALLMALAATAVAAQASPPVELPEYTDQQRWERAAMHAGLFPVALLRVAAAEGETAADAGRGLFDIFGPGWSGVTTPQQFAVAMHRNWSLWPDGRLEIVEQSAESVTVRVNRPWSGVFGDDETAYGVPMADMDTFFLVFHDLVADQQGMDFDYTTAPDHLTIRITRR